MSAFWSGRLKPPGRFPTRLGRRPSAGAGTAALDRHEDGEEQDAEQRDAEPIPAFRPAAVQRQRDRQQQKEAQAESHACQGHRIRDADDVPGDGGVGSPTELDKIAARTPRPSLVLVLVRRVSLSSPRCASSIDTPERAGCGGTVPAGGGSINYAGGNNCAESACLNRRPPALDYERRRPSARPWERSSRCGFPEP
jgi:hypothetical protein